MAVTPRQREILVFVQEHLAKHERSPTRAEIADHFGFSSLGTVQRHLDRLVAHGLLSRAPHKHRSLAPASSILPEPPQGDSLAVVPLLGAIRAGAPVESFPVSTLLDIPRWLLGDGEHFALQVVGDSMAGEGILHGDTVLVHRQPVPRAGDVVVALVRGEATIKRFFPLGDGVVELRPSNPSYLPIRVRPMEEDDLLIQGVVVGLIRKLSHT